MSDNLFVRDLIERLSKLDPQLPTNIAGIQTGSFQDGTRVHMLKDEEEEAQFLKDQLVVLNRACTQTKSDLDKLESQVRDRRVLYGKELLDHNTQILLLRAKLRKIKHSMYSRPLHLP